MDWLEITIETTRTGIEETAAALTAGGFSDLVLEDQGELEGFLEENRAYWDYIDESLARSLQGLSRIRLYLEAADEAGLARLKTLLAAHGDPKTDIRPLADENWEESWKENYPPQLIGKRLIVLPHWNSTQTQGRLPVILDPGLTFGTGAHPSTQMVMEVMETLPLAHSSCLDLGSGSGILSIAALRLGAEKAVGIDIDPKAEDIARENAAYNGFGAPEFTALTGNVTQDQKLMARLRQDRYDLVLVNIVADVILALAPVLPQLLEETSTLICSGILDSRLDEVAAGLEKAGLEVTRTLQKDDWRCVCAKRRVL